MECGKLSQAQSPVARRDRKSSLRGGYDVMVAWFLPGGKAMPLMHSFRIQVVRGADWTQASLAAFAASESHQ